MTVLYRYVCPRLGCPNAITLAVPPHGAPTCWQHPRGQLMIPAQTAKTCEDEGSPIGEQEPRQRPLLLPEPTSYKEGLNSMSDTSPLTRAQRNSTRRGRR